MEIRDEQVMEEVLRDIKELLFFTIDKEYPPLSREQYKWLLTGAIWALQQTSWVLMNAQSPLFGQSWVLLDRVAEFLIKEKDILYGPSYLG